MTTRERPTARGAWLTLLLLLQIIRPWDTVVQSARASDVGVSYQIHSYDDLREWPQLFLKGADWFKFDFNYQSPTFCQNGSVAVSRVNRDTSDLGCFLLNHDPPVQTRSAGYNTSDDILTFISDHLEQFNQIDRPIHIALCMKYSASDNLCDGTPAAQNATALFTSFFEAANELIEANDLSLEFILDGSLTPSMHQSCLKDLWTPWNATFILDSDPAVAYQTNNISTGAERFQINNMDELSFILALASKYGKFAHPENDTNGFTKSYPYLIWEPSDQTTLSLNTASYLAGPRHLLPDGSPGLRFAINIDPITFTIYTGSVLGDAWNFPASTLATDTYPKSAVWCVSGSTNTDTIGLNLLIQLWYDSPNDRLMYREYQFDYALSTPWPLTAHAQELVLDVGMRVANVTGNIGSFIALPANSFGVAGALLLGDDSGFISVRDMRDISQPSIFNGSLMNTGTFSRLAAAVDLTTDNVDLSRSTSTDSLFILQATNSNDCAILLQAFRLTNGELEPIALETEACITAATTVNQLLGQDVSISLIAINDTSLCGESHTTGPSQVWYGYLLAYSFQGQIYSTYGCVAPATGLIIGLDEISITVGPISWLGVGDGPSVSTALQPATNVPFAMITAGNSYCFNNEYVNKRAEIGLCDSVPNNQSQVQTYTYGRLIDFTSMIDRNESISPCAMNGLVHGMYDMGSLSFMSLFVGPTNDTNRLEPENWTIQVIESHVGYSTTDTNQPSSTTMSRVDLKAGERRKRSLHAETTRQLNSQQETSSISSTPATRFIRSFLRDGHANTDSTTPHPVSSHHHQTPPLRPLDRSPFDLASDSSDSSSSPPTSLPIPPAFCGAPIGHSGIVVDGWQLPLMN